MSSLAKPLQKTARSMQRHGSGVGRSEQQRGRCSSLVSEKCHEKIFELVAKLTAGDSFILVNDHDQKPLYYQNIRASFPGPISKGARRCGASRLVGCRRRHSQNLREVPISTDRHPLILKNHTVARATLSRWTMSYFLAALVSLRRSIRNSAVLYCCCSVSGGAKRLVGCGRALTASVPSSRGSSELCTW